MNAGSIKKISLIIVKIVKKNICTLCLSEHSNHNIILLADLLPNKFDLMKKSNEFKDSIISFNDTINNIIEELNNMKENMSYYSKMYEF